MRMTDIALSALDRLEAAINLRWERTKVVRWQALLDFEPAPECFPRALPPKPLPTGRWPDTSPEGALAEAEQELLGRLEWVYRVVCKRALDIPDVNCSSGRSLLPAMLGADGGDPGRTERAESGTDLDALEQQLQDAEPDTRSPVAHQVLSCANMLDRALTTYPATSSVLHIQHPNLGSPEDALAQLAGRPLAQLVRESGGQAGRLLKLLATAGRRFVDLWHSVVRPSHLEHFSWHGLLFRGQVMLCSDSLADLGAAEFTRYVQPVYESIFARFGGGAVTVSGSVDGCIEALTGTAGLTAVLVTEPERNDMQRVYEATIGQHIVLSCPWEPEPLEGLDLSTGYVPTDPATFENLTSL